MTSVAEHRHPESDPAPTSAASRGALLPNSPSGPDQPSSHTAGHSPKGGPGARPGARPRRRSFLREQAVLARLGWRVLSELSPRALFKMLYLYAAKGAGAIWAYERRLKKGELYPPFLFIAVTNTCNLRCHGCWVEKEGEGHFLDQEDLDRMIDSGKKRRAHYYTLLGGEPYLWKGIWDVFDRHSDCYFQTITNGMLFTDENVERLRQAGNVTPLISLDGFEGQNDLRRGQGVWNSALEGMDRLKKAKLFYGVATTATALNMEEVMSDEYVQFMIDKGAMYLWYYVYRPMSPEPHTEYCVSEEQLLWMRRRLLELRRTHPILVIDTYWTADGEAFCPAATGLGFHIGPQGSVEICPALSFATDTVKAPGAGSNGAGSNGAGSNGAKGNGAEGNGAKDNGTADDDLWKTFNDSDFLRGFQGFVKDRTKGCVILEHPQELHDYIRDAGAKDYSGRGSAFEELGSLSPRHSHHLPGKEIPEDFWFYRLLKKNVFFGMGAIG